jgi:hypothetical protein
MLTEAQQNRPYCTTFNAPNDQLMGLPVQGDIVRHGLHVPYVRFGRMIGLNTSGDLFIVPNTKVHNNQVGIAKEALVSHGAIVTCASI